MFQAQRLDTRNEIQIYKIKVTGIEIIKGGRLLFKRTEGDYTLK
jgi:hypothetical protein